MNEQEKYEQKLKVWFNLQLFAEVEKVIKEWLTLEYVSVEILFITWSFRLHEKQN